MCSRRTCVWSVVYVENMLLVVYLEDVCLVVYLEDTTKFVFRRHY